MHVAHERRHRVEDVVMGVDHDVEALVDDLEIGIGDQDGDLDEGVATQIEASHLAVDPHQFFGHG